MNEKETGLENFIERHRADFDVFEPRPDLWNDLEQQLAAPPAGTGAPATAEAEATELVRVVKLYPDASATALATPAAPVEVGHVAGGSQWPRPGMAAAVAVLLLAGIGAVWRNEHRTASWASTGTGATPLVLAAADPAAENAGGLYVGFGASPVANTAEAPAGHLTTAVRRMERYYATQIRERKEALHQLEAATAVASVPPADWRRELSGLDSTYQQLKVELYRNPEPDVVLEAMNRNLQIRLDILNQQTRSREQVQDYHARPLLVADTHPMP